MSLFLLEWGPTGFYFLRVIALTDGEAALLVIGLSLEVENPQESLGNTSNASGVV